MDDRWSYRQAGTVEDMRVFKTVDRERVMPPTISKDGSRRSV
jgi:hypothetical protein